MMRSHVSIKSATLLFRMFVAHLLSCYLFLDVTTGHRWFTWICNKMNIDPITTFRGIVRQNFRGKIKGPYNVEDRLTAGMTGEWYENLEGHGESRMGGAKAGKESEGDLRLHPRLT